MTRQEIKENRLKFANGLLEPHRMKQKPVLENRTNPNKRCCLGHGCDIFGIIRNVDGDGDIIFGEAGNNGVAPVELMYLLGLYRSNGAPAMNLDLYMNCGSLASINDKSDLTTQQIGQLILEKDWVEGGENTPFKPLFDYPEA